MQHQKFKIIIISILFLSALWALDKHSGKVVETMNSGGYTYCLVVEGDTEYWVAGPEAWVKPGATISFYEQMIQSNFTSRTLGRTFDSVMFISGLTVDDPGEMADTTASNAPVEKVEDAGTFSVADLHIKRLELAGKSVSATGTVTKVSEGIMSNNWIHISDGSGEGETSTIIFKSTTTSATVGDTVMATGVLAVDKDFGYGYSYSVIVENARVTQGKK